MLVLSTSRWLLALTHQAVVFVDILFGEGVKVSETTEKTADTHIKNNTDSTKNRNNCIQNDKGKHGQSKTFSWTVAMWRRFVKCFAVVRQFVMVSALMMKTTMSSTE